MLRSLNSRLLLSNIVVILACLTLVGLGLLVFVRTSPLWTMAAALRLEAAERATMPMISRAGPANALPPEQLHAVLDQAAEEQEVRILLVDGAGTALFDSAGLWAGREFVEFAQEGTPRRPPPDQGVFEVGETRWVFVAEVLPGGAGRQQVVVFTTRLVRQLMLIWFVQNLLPPLVRAGLAALVLSVLVAWLVARSVARPLERVADAAGGIAQGDLSQRAPVSGPLEAQELAQAFNRMVDQVASSQQAQRDLVANISHELKTPLTSIQGFSQAIIDGTAGDREALERSVGIIHGEAERMRRMVDQLLDLARFDAGQVQMTRVPVDVAVILEQCVERLAPQASATGNELALSAQPGLMVNGDADWIMQMLANLVDNAVRHTRGALVEVAAHRAGDWVEIAVTDKGEGIPPEDLERIFERFYQADRSRVRRGGAGLGLSIVREVARLHGGTVSAESVVGLGSRFTVRLPILEGGGPQV